MIRTPTRARFRVPRAARRPRLAPLAMATGRLQALLAACALLAGCSSVSPSAAVTPAQNTHRLERTAELEQRAHDIVVNREPLQLVFLGDSITEQWETAGRATWDQHYRSSGALNLGIGGDQTQNVLYRLQDGHLDGLNPDVLVLMIGTNNTGNGLQSPSSIRDGIADILGQLREIMPTSHVLLLAIFPRGVAPDDPLRRNNEAVNRLLPALCDGTRVTWLDINAAFLEPDGTLSAEIMPDALHLSSEGYQRWARVMAPTLETLLLAPRPQD